MITFQHVSKTFGSNENEVKAVQDVTLEVMKGDIFGVIGFSGAGKSTLLRLVNLLERPTTGEILVNEQSINTLSQKELRKLRSKIGMIFQSFNLFSSRTVYGNIAYPLKLAGWPKDKIDFRVKELLAFVGLEDKEKKFPEKLSGGQKQRVGIARALATSPDILICDEATSALDPETTEEILNLLKKINNDYKITIMLITHEMHVIKKICNRVAVMEDGRVIEEGQVFDVFTNPVQKTTQNFIRSVLNDKLSSQLYEKLKKEQRGRMFRIYFKEGVSNEPILSRTCKKYDIDFNIIYGNINELQERLFGSLIVEFIGAPAEVENVIADLEKIVVLKELVNNEG
ncbi:methionine ABC transporter ATP-binding protein [Cytobacillus horneckiae]|uniref:Phosphate ABC transporter ATP-binding protein n=1 Tax=Cytobacillus horneckiae TaxID=549687 RepID=A0A2N0ZH79_9BACI|nr:ATP-binding cassette domain-containing protein [Cytobacillus horneckiae]MEC1157613.1 ATP-binding cassette domain-containing protein [Cytobacillus horneckiae]MED2939232.1 ATP-binding cassette domain-containing protein [Cytobacillus horneckiae]PKG28868.1 phosphate ABC transporter ATP-binding protein [Cytobacillus horneckiae]